VVTIFLCAEVK